MTDFHGRVSVASFTPAGNKITTTFSPLVVVLEKHFTLQPDTLIQWAIMVEIMKGDNEEMRAILE